MKTNLKQFLPASPQIKRTVNPNGLEVNPQSTTVWNGSEFEFPLKNEIKHGGLYFKDVSLIEGLKGTGVMS